MSLGQIWVAVCDNEKCTWSEEVRGVRARHSAAKVLEKKGWRYIPCAEEWLCPSCVAASKPEKAK